MVYDEQRQHLRFGNYANKKITNQLRRTTGSVRTFTRRGCYETVRDGRKKSTQQCPLICKVTRPRSIFVKTGNLCWFPSTSPEYLVTSHVGVNNCQCVIGNSAAPPFCQYSPSCLFLPAFIFLRVSFCRVFFSARLFLPVLIFLLVSLCLYLFFFLPLFFLAFFRLSVRPHRDPTRVKHREIWCFN